MKDLLIASVLVSIFAILMFMTNFVRSIGLESTVASILMISILSYVAYLVIKEVLVDYKLLRKTV